jgi:hypothetical protein
MAGGIDEKPFVIRNAFNNNTETADLADRKTSRLTQTRFLQIPCSIINGLFPGSAEPQLR